MLTVNLIQRLIDQRAFDRLLEAVSANGMQLPLPLRVRLGQTPSAPLALGLRRLVELTYHRTALSRQMARLLLDSQDADGSFDGDPVITATAVAALGRLLAEQPSAGDSAICQARVHALAALAAMQDDDGLFRTASDRTREDRAMAAAFVLYQLGGDDAFRQTVRIADLWRWFEQHDDRLDGPTQGLWRMGRCQIGTPRRPDAALAA